MHRFITAATSFPALMLGGTAAYIIAGVMDYIAAAQAVAAASL